MVEFETKPLTKTTESDYGTTETETRYIIVEKGTGKLLDDAQGYGYKTAQGAHKAGWYKFQRGKEHLLSKEGSAKQFWEQHPDAGKELISIMEYEVKRICFGEITIEELMSHVEKQFNIIIPESARKYLDMADAGYRAKWSKKNKKKKTKEVKR
jgi:hypothetical protein